MGRGAIRAAGKRAGLSSSLTRRNSAGLGGLDCGGAASKPCEMKEPARTLIGEIERVVSALPDAVLFRARRRTVCPLSDHHGRGAAARAGRLPDRPRRGPAGAGDAASDHRRVAGPGDGHATDAAAVGLAAGALAARRPDGAALRAGCRRGQRRRRMAGGRGDGAGGRPRRDVVLALFARALRRAGGRRRPGRVGDRAAEARCHRDPGLADHWLDFAELLEPEGRADGDRRDAGLGPARGDAADARADAGDRDARGARRRRRRRLAGFSDAIALEPVGARDDDARLDAAALVSVLAAERGDAEAVAAARGLLGEAMVATAAFWRGEAPGGAGRAVRAERGRQTFIFDGEISNVGTLALRIVGRSIRRDRDLDKLRAPTPALREGLLRLQAAREELESGQADAAVRAARAVVALPAMAGLGAAHAFLAEALNAVRSSDAAAAARRAIELNPALVDGWRELGDAELEAGALKEAEAAFRQVVAMDATYGLGYAKLAQVLLEQARTLEALEAIGEAGSRGGDPFFIAAIRGDIYAEMERHTDAADAYDLALAFEPEDHWALHQAALEHGFAGNTARASELFPSALTTIARDATRR